MQAEKTSYPMENIGILEEGERVELIDLFTQLLELENTLHSVQKAHRLNIRASSGSEIKLEKDQSNIIENQAQSRRASRQNLKEDESN